MQALIIKDDGRVYYIPKYSDELPKKLKQLYIIDAILVKNQEYAKNIMIKKLCGEKPNGNSDLINTIQNEAMSFPDLKVRIVEEPLEHLPNGFKQKLAIIEETIQNHEEMRTSIIKKTLKKLLE